MKWPMVDMDQKINGVAGFEGRKETEIMHMIKRYSDKLFSSQAIANILEVDHYNVKMGIRNLDLSDYGNIVDGETFSHCIFAENFGIDQDGSFVTTEKGLWFYLWSLPDPIDPGTLAKIIDFINLKKSQVYFNRIFENMKLIQKAHIILMGAIKDLAEINKPYGLVEDDPLPKIITFLDNLWTRKTDEAA